MNEIINNAVVVTESDFWKFDFLGNSIGSYISALFAFLVFLVLFKVLQKVILNKLEVIAMKTETDIDDTLINIVRSVRPPFYSFIAFYVGVQFLNLADKVSVTLNILLLLWVVYQIIIASQIFIEYIVARFFVDKDDKSAQGAMGVIKSIAKGLLWIIGALVVLPSFGVDVTSLIAGLGIGGIAIAFALQGILADLFSSFAIFFDKPFEVGDFIKLGDKSGTVKKIGIKTTRIKSTDGDEIVVSNQELTSAVLRNYKKMEERRISFSLGVTYNTPGIKLKKIPVMLKEVIDNTSKIRFDRAHFKTFGDFAQIFEVVYYVESSAYGEFMDAQQTVNFAIKEAFDKEGVEMAFPTQTLYMEKS